MAEGTGTTPPAGSDEARVDRQEDLVWWVTWLGVVLAAAGVVDGVLMAADKEVAPCSDAASADANLVCYAHPQADLGVAVALLAVLLGILVVFGSILVRASLRASAPPR